MVVISFILIITFFSKRNNSLNFLSSRHVRQKTANYITVQNPTNNKNSSSRGPKEFVRRAKYFSNVNLPKFSLSEFKGFLDAQGRSSDSLVAVYLLTNNDSLIPELEKHTSDSEAMLCLALASKIPVVEARKFAEAYCRLNPLQMQGYLLLANIDLGEGRGVPKDPDAFLELVNKGISSEEISLGLDRAASNQRKALEYIGTNPLDAEAILASSNDKEFILMSYCKNMMTAASKMELAGATTEIRKIEIVKKYLSAAESIKEISPYSSLNGQEGRHIHLMNVLIDQLPHDAQLGDEWGTVDQLREKLRTEHAEMLDDLTRSGDFLFSSPPEVLNNFLTVRMESGPQAAQKWLSEQSGRR